MVTSDTEDPDISIIVLSPKKLPKLENVEGKKSKHIEQIEAGDELASLEDITQSVEEILES